MTIDKLFVQTRAALQAESEKRFILAALADTSIPSESILRLINKDQSVDRLISGSMESFSTDTAVFLVTQSLEAYDGLTIAQEGLKEIASNLQMVIVGATLLGVVPGMFISPFLTILGVTGAVVSVSALDLVIKVTEIGKVVPKSVFDEIIEAVPQHITELNKLIKLPDFPKTISQIQKAQEKLEKMCQRPGGIDDVLDRSASAQHRCEPSVTFDKSGWTAENFKQGLEKAEHLVEPLQAMKKELSAWTKKVSDAYDVVEAHWDSEDHDTGADSDLENLRLKQYDYLETLLSTVHWLINSQMSLAEAAKIALKSVAKHFEVKK